MSKPLFLMVPLLCALLTSPCLAGEKNVTELRQIAQAGGSLIVDMDKRRYTVTELINVASALIQGATLTIKMDDNALTVTQCAQIARAKPGQVRFWF
ncbi:MULTISPECIES: hypothetical protein [unclassified Desulfovibrio]|uniref:hypothetical protein n=1 Tax=unclassified Desulfovibrio TaxID=2593640 RepID=UPI000F5E97C2|nr:MULTISPECIES: hypothetical protein [unclassified Desulfovibrio]RRD69055.1 hypothetical protein EII24_11580 [Desulfovibrio sp. OH1209_COT-279]RRD84340.1 hypothetical protein EII23_11580 [Desulfovibrio sp. OH1186_COT-070]